MKPSSANREARSSSTSASRTISGANVRTPIPLLPRFPSPSSATIQAGPAPRPACASAQFLQRLFSKRPMDSRTHTPEMGIRPERRRVQSERRQSWTADELYNRLRSKREEIENERRQGGRRASDLHSAP